MDLDGIGHTVGNHGPLAHRPSPAEAELDAAMRAVPLSLAAPLHRTVAQGFLGDSLSLGLMLFGFGLTQLLFERALRRQGLALPPSLLVVDLVVTATSFLIAALCFPIQPAIGLTLVFVAYAAALMLRLRRDRE